MKLLHVFYQRRGICERIVSGTLAGGMLLISTGCTTWLGSSISGYPPRPIDGLRVETSTEDSRPLPERLPAAENSRLATGNARTSGTLDNPLRPKPAPSITELSPRENTVPLKTAEVQQVGRDVADNVAETANRALWEAGLTVDKPMSVNALDERRPVGFAPSFLDSIGGDVAFDATELARQTRDSQPSDGLQLIVELPESDTILGSFDVQAAGRYFSKTLFVRRPTSGASSIINDLPDSYGLPQPNQISALPIATSPSPQPELEALVNALPSPEKNGSANSIVATSPLVADLTPRTVDPLQSQQESVFKQSNEEVPEWWIARVADVQRKDAILRQVGLSNLIDQAITQSPKIRMLERMPALAETEIERERSAFDPALRLDTRYRDDQDPVANQLQTGGPPVLKDNTWSATAGVQRRFETGTTADLFQRLGFKNSNSLFFSPQDQGTATIGLDINHPLLRNNGRELNRSMIVLAELQGQISFYEYQAELQREMVEIGNLYWQLLNSRQLVLQTERSRDRAKHILDILIARANYDATANQVATATSEVSQRETELLDARRNLRELEIALRDKVNDSDFATDQDVELIPAEFYDEVFTQEHIELQEALTRAMANRWELQQAEGRTQVADRQLFVSRCGLAPKLDLVLGVYSTGLAGGTGIEQAWTNQFGSATPGYYGGLEYEVPYGRRQAKAAVQRDQLQKQQAMDAYQVVRNEVIAQVKTAYVRVETAIEARAAAFQSVLDMRAALVHMQQRWEAAALIEGNASQGTSPSLALEQLLTGQQRLQQAEARLASADLQLALTRQALLLAMGEVLQTQVARTSPAIDLLPESGSGAPVPVPSPMSDPAPESLAPVPSNPAAITP
ncbi:MAG: TolC family protein [Planctomycetaceae bacterium]|nr:TolC family protein [Planctomycetaceae bacterium]